MSDAKAAAEVRRAKILARGKSRIDSIGEGLSKDDDIGLTRPAASRSESLASPVAPPTPSMHMYLHPPALHQSRADEVVEVKLLAPLHQETNGSASPLPPQASTCTPTAPPAQAPVAVQHSTPPAPQSELQVQSESNAGHMQHSTTSPTQPQQPHLSLPDEGSSSAALHNHQIPPGLRYISLNTPMSRPDGAVHDVDARLQTEQCMDPLNAQKPAAHPGSSATAAAPALISPAAIILLNTSVRASRLLRFVAAVWYAHALHSSRWPPILPPMLVLLVTQVAIIFGTQHLLSLPACRLILETINDLDAAAEVQVPARLRGFDAWGFLLRLSPEIRAVNGTAASGAALVKGLADGVAVFLVACVLMQQVSSLFG